MPPSRAHADGCGYGGEGGAGVLTYFIIYFSRTFSRPESLGPLQNARVGWGACSQQWPSARI